MSDQHAPDKFEETDWDVRPVVYSVVALLGFLVLGLILGFGTEKLVKVRLDLGEEKVAFHETPVTPPGPRLQVDEPADLKNFRDREDKLLSTYAWVDPAKGVIRIPIDRAIDVVAAEGAGGKK